MMKLDHDDDSWNDVKFPCTKQCLRIHGLVWQSLREGRSFLLKISSILRFRRRRDGGLWTRHSVCHECGTKKSWGPDGSGTRPMSGRSMGSTPIRVSDFLCPTLVAYWLITFLFWPYLRTSPFLQDTVGTKWRKHSLYLGRQNPSWARADTTAFRNAQSKSRTIALSTRESVWMTPNRSVHGCCRMIQQPKCASRPQSPGFSSPDPAGWRWKTLGRDYCPLDRWFTTVPLDISGWSVSCPNDQNLTSSHKSNPCQERDKKIALHCTLSHYMLDTVHCWFKVPFLSDLSCTAGRNIGVI